MKQLAIFVVVASVLALAVGWYNNRTERRIRLAGITHYNLIPKGGDFLHSPHGKNFDDDSLAEVVKIAADFSRPHSIEISGNDVTDDGFKVFENAPKIGGIWLTDSTVSDAIFNYLDTMPDLDYLRIENCPSIRRSEILKFCQAHPNITVKLKEVRHP